MLSCARCGCPIHTGTNVNNPGKYRRRVLEHEVNHWDNDGDDYEEEYDDMKVDTSNKPHENNEKKHVNKVESQSERNKISNQHRDHVERRMGERGVTPVWRRGK
jgi:hypothetical protein